MCGAAERTVSPIVPASSLTIIVRPSGALSASSDSIREGCSMVSLKLRCWQVNAGCRDFVDGEEERENEEDDNEDDDKEEEDDKEGGARASEEASAEIPSIDRNSAARAPPESSETLAVVRNGIDFRA